MKTENAADKTGNFKNELDCENCTGKELCAVNWLKKEK